MQINQFPRQYESLRKNKADHDASAERYRSSSRQESIRESISESAETVVWAGVCAVIGFFIGFFVCCNMCTNGAEGEAFVTWLALTIGGAIFGAILAGLINARYNSSVKDAEKEVASEQSRCEKAVLEIHAQAAREIATYKTEFEAEARRMSVQYAESAFVTEVTNWLTDGFSVSIDAAARGSYIEEINVPFSFKVYTNRITCYLGTYDFEIKRCANLTSPLQQTAIAMAIASAIQLNVTMKYPKDVSGTEVALNISYAYSVDTSYTYSGYLSYSNSEECVAATITYNAPNGNYRSVQSW